MNLPDWLWPNLSPLSEKAQERIAKRRAETNERLKQAIDAWDSLDSGRQLECTQIASHTAAVEIQWRQTLLIRSTILSVGLLGLLFLVVLGAAVVAWLDQGSTRPGTVLALIWLSYVLAQVTCGLRAVSKSLQPISYVGFNDDEILAKPDESESLYLQRWAAVNVFQFQSFLEANNDILSNLNIVAEVWKNLSRAALVGMLAVLVAKVCVAVVGG